MEDQILDLETKYWHGMANHDYETVKSLTYFPCTTISKQGVKSIDEPTFKQMFEQGEGMKMSIKGITEAVIEMFSKSFATIGYIVEIETDNNGEKTSSKCACSSAWIQENGVWKCQLHSESDLK